jgi:hypothetical protein
LRRRLTTTGISGEFEKKSPIVAGRTFTASEDSPNGGHVVVLSNGLWKRRFGGKPDIVGTNIQLDGRPYLVVGVIGRSFVTEPAGDLWLPYQFDLTSQDMATTSSSPRASNPESRRKWPDRG